MRLLARPYQGFDGANSQPLRPNLQSTYSLPLPLPHTDNLSDATQASSYYPGFILNTAFGVLIHAKNLCA